MVNLFCFRALADRRKLSLSAVRFFCALMANYDLTKFRSINLNLAGSSSKVAQRHLRKLVQAGLLEPGPVKARTPLYRLGAQCRATAAEVQRWVQDTAEYRERMQIAPLPADPRDIPAWLAGLSEHSQQ